MEEVDVKICKREVCEKCEYYGGVTSGNLPICEYILYKQKRRPCPAGDCTEFVPAAGPRKQKSISII